MSRGGSCRRAGGCRRERGRGALLWQDLGRRRRARLVLVGLLQLVGLGARGVARQLVLLPTELVGEVGGGLLHGGPRLLHVLVDGRRRVAPLLEATLRDVAQTLLQLHLLLLPGRAGGAREGQSTGERGPGSQERGCRIGGDGPKFGRRGGARGGARRASSLGGFSLVMNLSRSAFFLSVSSGVLPRFSGLAPSAKSLVLPLVQSSILPALSRSPLSRSSVSLAALAFSSSASRASSADSYSLSAASMPPHSCFPPGGGGRGGTDA